ncbi:YeeE/YedE family protein [bacterium]|nr:YeeE/YedE family protein [bacterium]
MTTAFLSGLLFALGLGISGMAQPQKVQGFLNFFGNWDPSLVWVMAGAVVVHALAVRLTKQWPHPVAAPQWNLPTEKRVTGRLLIGATAFGLGWGLAGYCPGPAIVSLAALQPGAFVFMLGLLAGLGLGRFALRLTTKKLSAPSLHSRTAHDLP